MTSKTSSKPQGAGRKGSDQMGSDQMGGAATAPQPQQSGGAPAAQADPAQKPIRYTDWASI